MAPQTQSDRTKRLLWTVAGLFAISTGLLGLAWIDILPGGWTLRGWVKPHHERQAEARLAYEAERLAGFEAQRDATPTGGIFFGGSSTIERFPFERFEAGHLINRGINDEPSEHFLARFERSLPTQPIGGAVLYMASVDFRRLLASPAEIESRVREILNRVLRAIPEGRILLIGILPEQQMPDGWMERLAETNARLRSLCVELDVDFLESALPPIALPNGDLNPTLAADRWHLNRKGYDALLERLWSEFPRWRARLNLKD